MIPARSVISISVRFVMASCSRPGTAGSALSSTGRASCVPTSCARLLGSLEDEVIMTCVAMGYPDDNFAANAVRSDREGNDEFVRYVGFAD